MNDDLEEQGKRLVEDFEQRLRAGESPDPDQFIAAHPEFGAFLEQRLEALAKLYEQARDRPQFGRYWLLWEIGSGSSAVVYRAVDSATMRTVALKIYRGVQLGGSVRERFERDARVLTRLKHSHIVQIIDHGIHDNQPYIALELMEAGSLDQLLQAGTPLAPADALELMILLVEAVHYAHEQGVIHRDIKPGNVLIGPRGEPQLSDFELARDLQVGGGTSAGRAIGTPAYMAPEQASGRSHQADARTDVYGLGALFFRLLTGRPPFDGSDPGTLHQRILHDPPSKPSRLNQEVPPGLEQICLKCLQKDPKDRFATAAALEEQLRHWRDGGRVVVWLPSLAGRARRWWRRQKRWVRAAVSATAILSLACVVFGWLAWSFRETAALNRQKADLAHGTAELQTRAAGQAHEREVLEARLRARAEVREALDRGWRILRGTVAGRRREVGEALKVVARVEPMLPADVKESFLFEARTLYAMSLSVDDLDFDPKARILIKPSALTGWSVAPHPDGKWIALAGPNGPLRVERDTQLNIPAPVVGQVMPRIAFSPDGRFLVYASALGALDVWEGALAKRITSIKTSSPILAVGFTEECRELLACCRDGTVKRWRTSDWDEQGNWSLPKEAGAANAVRFTQDGARLAAGFESGRVRIFTSMGHEEREPPAPDVRTEVQSLAWSPDGRQLAAGFKEGVVAHWWADGTLRRRFQAFLFGVDQLEFSPDGSVLAASQYHPAAVMWDTDTGYPLVSGTFRIGGFDRSGHTVAISWGDSMAFAEYVKPSIVRVFRGHQLSVQRLAWSSDGRRLASVDTGFNIRVWDVPAGREASTFRAPIGGFFAGNTGLALSNDGQLIAYAGGGRDTSIVEIREVASPVGPKPWKLPGGFDYLAASGKNQFRLVREEFLPESKVLQTVLYKLQLGREPERVRVLREPRAEDERLYLGAALTPDGRFYGWCGPREPKDHRRWEVIDIDADRHIVSEEFRNHTNGGDPMMEFDPGSRILTLNDSYPRTVCLPGHEAMPVKSIYWYRGWFGEEPNRLRANGPVFGLTGSGFFPEHKITILAPSPDGQWLAWADCETGAILIADREALHKVLVDFDLQSFR